MEGLMLEKSAFWNLLWVVTGVSNTVQFENDISFQHFSHFIHLMKIYTRHCYLLKSSLCTLKGHFIIKYMLIFTTIFLSRANLLMYLYYLIPVLLIFTILTQQGLQTVVNHYIKFNTDTSLSDKYFVQSIASPAQVVINVSQQF